MTLRREADRITKQYPNIDNREFFKAKKLLNSFIEKAAKMSEYLKILQQLQSNINNPTATPPTQSQATSSRKNSSSSDKKPRVLPTRNSSSNDIQHKSITELPKPKSTTISGKMDFHSISNKFKDIKEISTENTNFDKIANSVHIYLIKNPQEYSKYILDFNQIKRDLTTTWTDLGKSLSTTELQKRTGFTNEQIDSLYREGLTATDAYSQAANRHSNKAKNAIRLFIEKAIKMSKYLEILKELKSSMDTPMDNATTSPKGNNRQSSSGSTITPPESSSSSRNMDTPNQTPTKSLSEKSTEDASTQEQNQGIRISSQWWYSRSSQIDVQ